VTPLTPRNWKNTKDAELIRFLENLLRDDYPIPSTENITILNRISSNTSEIFQIDYPFFSYPLTVKRIHSGEDSVASQFDALKNLNGKLGDGDRFRVPNAVALDEANGFLVMEWIDLPSVEQNLKSWRTSKSNILMVLKNAGEWISRLHSVNKLQSANLNSKILIDDITETLATFNDISNSKSRLMMFVRTLRETALLAAQFDIQKGLQHGDYKPSNILSDSRSTVAIDCHAIHEGPIINDLSHFLNHLDFSLLFPFRRSFFCDRNLYINAFLDAYSRANKLSMQSVPLLPLNWLRLHQIVRLWVSDLDSSTPLPIRLYRSWCYREVGRSLLSTLLSGARSSHEV
jgi:tRNA A-37 threonylcarbamoyl transferase component Bud32